MKNVQNDSDGNCVLFTLFNFSAAMLISVSHFFQFYNKTKNWGSAKFFLQRKRRNQEGGKLNNQGMCNKW